MSQSEFEKAQQQARRLSALASLPWRPRPLIVVDSRGVAQVQE